MKKELRVNSSLYKTYIFDLYGTLIDIKTDEDDPVLWKNMADIYTTYGADYTPLALKKAYIEFCNEETDLLRLELKGSFPDMNPVFPEIRLEKVFARLLTEAPLHVEDVTKSVLSDNSRNTSPSISMSRTTSATINGKTPSSLSVEELSCSEWAYMVANTFRIISRERMSLYKNTLSTLKALRQKGCKLYLLSNAQGIFTRPELEAVGLVPYLDGIYISSEKQIKKPQPEFMEWLISEYRIDRNSAVMVGNEMNCDMGIAKASGLPGVFLNTFEWSDAKIDKEMKKLGVDSDSVRIIMDGDISHLLD